MTTIVKPQGQSPILSSPVIGMTVFVFTEIMFFMALISAFMVIKAGTPEWSIPEGVRLPIETTILNTIVLLMSGVCLWVCRLHLKKSDGEKAAQYLLRASLLGLVFVGIQGYEWVKLLQFGMTLKSGIFSGCFYLLIGSHGLHALSGALALLWYYLKSKAALKLDVINGLTIFWFFIVGVWPVLFRLVYF